ncbi:hypothetical protein OG379_28220 [Streptomyces sp. NBC_01166]|uniref:hypothetical protein n=1 Tax=Streptomyces sp. NBC_01166 TaxID=2903755 RepID=UPI0038671DC0|nr:hypothetical protein OG379_28220 [Streptomyces sp. NBC_01166]
MSEPKKPGPGSETQPELTPAEQQKQDTERVQGQLIVTDVTRQMQGVMEAFGFGSPGASGRTSFEGVDLNVMIDLIENSNPEHLEEAGRALLKARTAISDAARELGGFINGVDWEGESGVAFQDWGTDLVAHAEKLGEFAQAAGTQITVAGTGLASVRNSLPPRDSRLIRKSPEDIESPARIETNPEYAAALKVEKDRQEAINQANRLASYYAVAGETLASQEPPRFDKKLDVAMPRPGGYIRPTTGSESSSAGPGASGNGVSQEGASHAPSSRAESGGTSGQAVIEPPVTPPVLDKGASTEINSVSTAPPPVTSPNTPSPVPTTSPAVPGGGPNLPMAPGFVNPVTNSSRGPQGTTGAPRAVGQTGPGGSRSGSGPAANSRAGSPVGRPAPMGGGSASGTTGRPGGGPQAPTAGRSGVTGGRPMAAGQAGTSGATSPRAGRGGIVGGTPQRTVPGAGASGGTRGVSRGTVIGAGGTSSTSRPGGRGTPSTNGVVGTPRGGAARPGVGAKGFTAGGAGLVRGPAGRKDSRDEDQDDGTPRPDFLTEDRETWEAGRRGSAPPVIE